jgi:hypothetical protein
MSGHDLDGLPLWAALCGDASAAALAALLAAHARGGADVLTLPCAGDKRARAAQHALVRSHFPCLDSESRGGAVQLRCAPPLKAVAVDLDGTLWPGVLLEGCGDWAPGFARLAAALLQLQARGVLLLSCSRNDEAPVLAAWPPPARCALQPHHFVAHAFGWDAKSERLARFAQAAELAHGALLFLDDTAAERAEVRAALPRVRVLGADMSLAASVLEWEAGRLGDAVSADAARRTETTRALLARAAAAAAFEPPRGEREEPRVRGDRTRRRAAAAAGARARVAGTGGGYAAVGGFPLPFLRTLQLRLTLRCCCGDDSDALARAAELAARATQFNTASAAPRDALLARFQQLLAAGGEVWTLAAADRFGDHGTVGVAALDVPARRVDRVVVSCRVLALECAPVFVAEALRASAGAPGPLRAAVDVTERNAPCRSLFARLGFARQPDADARQEWLLAEPSALPCTDADVYDVTVETSAAGSSSQPPAAAAPPTG